MDQESEDGLINLEKIYPRNEGPSRPISSKDRMDQNINEWPTIFLSPDMMYRLINFRRMRHDSKLFVASDAPDSMPVPMSFGKIDVLWLIISICTYLFDLLTDLIMLVLHYCNGDYWYAVLTFIFVALPSTILTFISLRWYMIDSKDPKSLPISKKQWYCRIVFLILQLGPVLRYVDALVYGLKFRKLKKTNPEKAQRYFQYMIYEDTDANMLRLLECFMEAAPQLTLQLSIMAIKAAAVETTQHWTVHVAIISCLNSLISLSWSLVTYLRLLRMSLPHKKNLSKPGIITLFLWRLFMITSRVLALALFASEFTHYISIVCGLHWSIMFIWIFNMKTNFFENPFEELFFNAILAAVFIFCFFNPVDSPSKNRYVIYYMLMFVENLIILFLWYRVCDPSSWLRLPALIFYFISFFLAIISMLVHYLKFHPTQNIRIWRTSELAATSESNDRKNPVNEKVKFSSPTSSLTTIAVVYNFKDKRNNNFETKKIRSSNSLPKQAGNVWCSSERLLHSTRATLTL